MERISEPEAALVIVQARTNCPKTRDDVRLLTAIASLENLLSFG